MQVCLRGRWAAARNNSHFGCLVLVFAAGWLAEQLKESIWQVWESDQVQPAVSLQRMNKQTVKTRASGALRHQTRMPRPVFRLKSILVPIDFSAESEKALAYAVPFARQFGARLTVLHVVEPVAMPDFARSFPLTIENDKVMAECKGHLQRIVKDLKIEPALMEKTLVRTGRSFNEIAEAARTLKADLIIISTHGYAGLKHALLGSTTERVVRHAPCPVLVVRSHEHEFVVNNATPQLKEPI
jgi:nucleotide-binding universal stress UspA family protein